MKNILKYVLLLSLLVPCGAMARKHHHHKVDRGNESIIEFDQPAKIVIIEEGDMKSKCNVGGGGLALKLANSGNNGSWYLSTGGLGFGLDGAINQPEGTGLQMGKSFEVLWLKALAAEYRFKNQAISFGLGFDWKNFKMTGAPYRMVKRPMGGLALDEYPEGTTPLNSTLKIFSLDIPVLYSIQVPSIHTKFTVGPILNFNTYSSLKTNYINPAGNKTTEFVKGLDQKIVTMELFGAVSWNCLGLYVKGSPIKSMKGYSDINFNPFTVGVIFFM